MELILASGTKQVAGNSIAWIAAVITSIFLIPQIYTILKKKDATDTNLISVISLAIACIFWVLWSGLSQEPNWQVFTVNVCCFVCCVFIIYYKIYQYYSEKKIIKKIDSGLIKYNNIDIRNMSTQELEKIKEKIEKK